MIKNSITIQEVVNLLNGALESDREAITRLISTRVKCNSALANHPTIQIGSDKKGYSVGLLGILNGMFGVAEDGWGAIGANYTLVHTISAFEQIRFTEFYVGQKLKATNSGLVKAGTVLLVTGLEEGLEEKRAVVDGIAAIDYEFLRQNFVEVKV